MRYPDYHLEVLDKLHEIGRPQLAKHMAEDRKSKLEYSGVRVPDRRKLSRNGFSFYDQSESKILEVWNDLFMESKNGDVLFCALDYLRFRVPKKVPTEAWPIVRHWVSRVDNWAHADELSWVYSYVLEAHFDEVHPDLVKWNKQDDLWPKRISIVSLVHYIGKNAVFLSPEIVLPMVAMCVQDHRYYMQKATGWVLREMHRVYPEEIEQFLQTHLTAFGADAFARVIEKMDTTRRSYWRELRKEALTIAKQS